MSGDARLILVTGALLAAGVLASMAASRLRLPALASSPASWSGVCQRPRCGG